MYEYLFEKLNTEFSELTIDGKAHIFPSHIPDGVLSGNAIVYSIISSDVTYHSKMSTIQISCFSKSASESVTMSNRVVKLFQNMNITGKALRSKVLSTTDMLYDTDSEYYLSSVDILLQSTKEFV